MNSEEKLQQIVDRLLIKTQDNLCIWRKDPDNKYVLQTTATKIEIYYDLIIAGTSKVILNITRDHTTLISINGNEKDINSNLVRLYYAVTKYYKNYVNTLLESMLLELQKK